MYWARSRVLEYLNYVAGRLPPGVNPSLGPDATGVGWIYEYALVDRSGRHDLADLRSLQDWFLRYPLQTVPGVSEVASVGGFVKQYQVEVNPNALLAYNLPLAKIKRAIQRSNQDVGGKLVEMAETEYMVRGLGYIEGIEDLKVIPVGVDDNGTPIRLQDVAQVHLGPELRRGVAELDGEGEVAGGVVVMRYRENAEATIEGVRAKLAELRKCLPEGVEIVTVYDRGHLIERAVDNLKEKLIEESIVVSIITILFLLHARSALVAILTLPIGILMAFIVMHWQGINANIMSLGGIAIGAMVDGAIVMIENAHKHLEAAATRKAGALDNRECWDAVAESAREVGPALFFSLLIITVSFLPVFTLQAQEGRLFSPLAFTKTYAMAAAALLAITLVPVLMGYFIRGKILPEKKNPVNRLLHALHSPVLRLAIRLRWLTVPLAIALLAATWYPVSKLGSEFMPPLDEGDILLDFEINREAAARYGLTVGDVQDVISTAIGGMNITQTVEGLERYPVNLRYPRELRDNVEELRRVLIATPTGAQIPLSLVSDLNLRRGPPAIKTEDSRPNAWVYVDITTSDIGGYVEMARKVVNEQVDIPPGYTLVWSGQFEYMERAAQRLRIVVPATLLLIFLLLYLNFRNAAEPLVVMISIPFGLIGGFWLVYWLGFNLSVAVAVGFIALAGVAAEIGVLALTFIDQEVARRRSEINGTTGGQGGAEAETVGRLDARGLFEAVHAGTSERVRPIAMTATAIIAGLLPIMWGSGTGSDVMQRIAAPMVGGMVTVTILSLLVLPVIYGLVLQLRERRYRNT